MKWGINRPSTKFFVEYESQKELQESQKVRKIKDIESERRIMTQIDRVISKQLVQFAQDYNMGLRFEDLLGIRQTSLQPKKNKSDASKNRRIYPLF